ncbi:MAG: hypothetical protein RPS47_14580 [Colwellia sp.]|jgi:hypothetical protein
MNKLLIIACLAISSCAGISPLKVTGAKNIIYLSEQIAKSYTPGVMKIMTYTGMNLAEFENQEYRSVAFKVKGGVIERDNINLTFGKYCSKIGGKFNSENGAILTGLNTLVCNQESGLALFTVMINGKPYDRSKTLNCYSVMAIEDKNIGMNSSQYTERLSKLDKIHVGLRFNTTSGC